MKRTFLSVRNLAAGFGLLALSATFFACNKLDDNDDNVNNPAAGLMAFNLAPDQQAVGIALSGSTLTNSPLDYTGYTGAYVGIYPGTRTVLSYDFNTGRSIASVDQAFDPQKYYSVFVTGADSNYRNIVVRDDFDSLSGSSGQAYVRYINAIPDSSSPAVTISANGSNVVNENAAYASVSAFRAVSPGDITIGVSNGSTIDASRTITVEQNTAYTVLLIGRPGTESGTDSLQIRYVTNGTLTDEPAQRAARTVSSN